MRGEGGEVGLVVDVGVVGFWELDGFGGGEFDDDVVVAAVGAVAEVGTGGVHRPVLCGDVLGDDGEDVLLADDEGGFHIRG